MERVYAKRKHDPNQVFNFIVQFKSKNDGNSPTMREIGNGCGITSTFVVSRVIDLLRARGLIRLDGKPGATRSIVVVGGEWRFAKD